VLGIGWVIAGIGSKLARVVVEDVKEEYGARKRISLTLPMT
jgi:hypothetical protein